MKTVIHFEIMNLNVEGPILVKANFIFIENQFKKKNYLCINKLENFHFYEIINKFAITLFQILVTALLNVLRIWVSRVVLVKSKPKPIMENTGMLFHTLVRYTRIH